MGKIAKGLFGGGSDDAARQAAEDSKQAQIIANDRQMAALNEQEKATGASRRAPRGQRLFVSDQSSGGLASKLGG